MKKNVLAYFIILFFISTVSKSQTFVPGQEGMCVDLNASMYIPHSTTLHIDGNFYNKQAKPISWVVSNGVISLTGNLICNDPLICTRASSLTPDAYFIFSPNSPTVTVSGASDSIILYHTILNKPNTVVKINSGTKLKILDTLDFQGGNFMLDGGNIFMNPLSGTPMYVNHPYLKNERHSSRIFGDSGYVITQAIATVSNGLPPTSFNYNFANLGLTLSGITVLNASLTIQRGHIKQLYAGNGSIKKYFNVSSNQPLTIPSPISDSVRINYIDSADYINIGINRNKLKIFVSTGGDMDYFNLNSTNYLASHYAKGYMNNIGTASISSTFFRITVADEDCANPPVSALPNGTLNFCPGFTQILNAGNNTSVPGTSLVWLWSTSTNSALATTQTLSIGSTTTTQQLFLTLRDVRGCITKDTLVIAPTAPVPSASVYATSACFGDSIKIKSTSTIASGSITSYFWQYGDGGTYTTALNDTIKRLYASPGNYSISLTVTSNYGCTASVIKNVIAIPLPTANFTSTFNCITGLVDLTSTSSVPPIAGSITQHNWNFNLAASSSLTPFGTVTAVSHSYVAAGTYSVKLFVSTGNGCKDSITKTIIVNPKNISAFNSATTSCLGDTISFTNNSICNTGSCSYVWDFADGTQSFALNPKKVYTTSGVYNVKLKVQGLVGCPDSTSIPIVVNPKPIVGFTTTPVCLGNISYFNNNSTISTGSIVAYNWNLGNATSTTSTNAFATYTNSGNYNVSLSATSNLGCVATLTQAITVLQKPTAQYAVSNVCKGQPSVFNQNSSGGSLTYLWDFGNTITSPLSNPSYIYPSSGTYSTSLIVTASNGCSDTSAVTTTVYSVPNPALGGTITTCGTTYSLNAGTGVNYLWQPQNATTQTITITTNGTYTLTVTDANGCVGKDYVTVGLNTPVKPLLGNDTISCGPYLLNAGYPNSTYLWNTNPVVSTQTLLATIPSTYIVTVTDQNNCVGKDTVVVQINTPPTLNLGANITQCQTSQPLVLNPVTNASIFLWNNGTTQPTLSINNSGNYAVTVTATNGCKKSDTIAVNLLPSPIVNLGPDASVCGTKLLDAQNIGFNYLWSNGSNAQTVNAQTSGGYWVTVTNPGNGCFTKDTINLIISAPISVFLGNDTTTCSNAIFVLNAGNTGSTYNWSTGATTQTISTGSSGGYGVTVTSGVCSAFDAINITVLAAPVVNLGNSIQYLCGNGGLTLNAGNSAFINWGSNTGFTSTQTLVTITQPGNYWATVSNGFCSASDSVQIIQSSQTLNAYFIASTVDTVNVPVKFVDVSQPVPTTWNWNFGDGFYSTQQSPEHIFLTPQTYSVTLTIGNGFCISQITKSIQVFRSMPQVPKENIKTLDLKNFLVYPNPANQSFTTIFELNDIADIHLSVYELSGKLVYTANKNQSSIFEESTSISELTNGMYLIDIIAESQKGFVRQKSKLVIMK